MAFMRGMYVCAGRDEKTGRVGKSIKEGNAISSFLVKQAGNTGAYIAIGKRGTITMPKTMLGKRVKVRIEIIEDALITEEIKMEW